MRIKQEELPSAESFLWDFSQNDEIDNLSKESKDILTYKLIEFLELHKKRIMYEYNQYNFFLEGYKNGSASISEVTAAHDKFLKLLE